MIKLGSLVTLYNQIGNPAAANQWCVNTRVTYRGTKKPPKFESLTWPNSFVRNYKHGISQLGLDAYQAEWYQGTKERKLPTECTGLTGMAWHEKGLRAARKLLHDPRVRVLRAGAWDAPDARVLE